MEAPQTDSHRCTSRDSLLVLIGLINNEATIGIIMELMLQLHPFTRSSGLDE
uniref:Uncharacterized protein n=1 Tax=Arundo donax TaxID=35708 RepID=A0A0A9BBI5_ARUDO